MVFRRGHADAEIEAVFAKYDLDGDRILDEEEQRKMQEDLEGQKVRFVVHLMRVKYFVQRVESVPVFLRTLIVPGRGQLLSH